jgi:DNA-binding transcriptional ArsR family regulator
MSTPRPSTVEVIQGAAPAAAMLHPLRGRMLAALRDPHSATSLARQLGLPRQKVNYHLRELERHGLVELVEERRKGNCTERVLRARSRYYVISPETVGALAADPDKIRDRFSSAYLTALAARTVRDLGMLRERADRAGKRLATFSLEADIRFTSAGSRSAFAEELAAQVARLVEKYHDGTAEKGRAFRMVVGTYPAPGSRERRSAS